MIHVRELERGAVRQRLWFDEVDGGLGFAGLRREWGELLERSDAGPFLSWEWLYPWWRRVSPASTPRILVARDERGALQGLLPLCETRDLSAGVAIRRWGFLGDSWIGSDYLEVLAPRGRERELTELFAERLAARMDRIDVLELLDLPQGSVLADAVLSRLGSGALRAERSERFLCPQIEIRGEFAAYLDSVGRAENLARRRKWLAAQPGYAIEIAEKPEAVTDALSDFFQLHALRWEKDGGSQGIPGAAVRSFHRDATAFLSEVGKLRLYTLKVGGRALASVYGIVHGPRFYYYQSGYDPQWARRSVGLVLLGRTIQDAFAQQRVAFDFLRGSEPYKSEWANARRVTEGVRLVNRTAGGLTFLAREEGRLAIRAAAKKLIGQRVWQRLSQVRRRLAR